MFSNNQIKHKGFTLVELLIVVAIIGIMTVVTIPFFSRYGARSEFNLKVTEVKTLIDQMNAMAKNPEQGIAKYGIATDGNSIILQRRKTDASGGQTNEIVNKIDLTGKYFITDVPLVGDPSDSAQAYKQDYFSCESPGDVCCRQTTRGTDRSKQDQYCIDQPTVYKNLSNNIYFYIYGDAGIDMADAEKKSNQRAAFLLKTNPYQLTVKYQNKQSDGSWVDE